MLDTHNKFKIRDISKINNSELFALRRRLDYYYSVTKDKDRDYGFFDFIYTNVKMGGVVFYVDLNPLKNDNKATLVVPESFLKVHRDGLAYIIDTNYTSSIMLKNYPQEGGMDYLTFIRKLNTINQFMTYPCVSINEQILTIYHQDSVGLSIWHPPTSCYFFHFGDYLSCEEKIGLLEQIIRGQYEQLIHASSYKVHLIINHSRDKNDVVFQALIEKGYSIERHRVNP